MSISAKNNLKRLLAFLCLALVLLALLGLAYQYIAAKRDLAKPTVATLFSVNGLDMNLICKGNNSTGSSSTSSNPTVVLEAGLGGNWLDWVHVHDDLAKTTQVCAYDRLGKGSSQPTPSPQSANKIAKTLNELLSVAKIQEPYILVGHSAGGLFVREYYQNYPQQVVGLVLVDAAHENAALRLPEAWSKAADDVKQQLRLCRAVAPFGIIRLIGTANGFTPILQLNDAQKEEFISAFNRTHYCHSALKERTAYYSDIRQSNPPKSLGALPLVVLSRGKGIADADDSPFDLDEEAIKEIDTIWAELQEELVDLSTNSRHIIAKNSGHFIQVEEPELVIEAVNSVITLARSEQNN